MKSCSKNKPIYWWKHNYWQVRIQTLSVCVSFFCAQKIRTTTVLFARLIEFFFFAAGGSYNFLCGLTYISAFLITKLIFTKGHIKVNIAKNNLEYLKISQQHRYKQQDNCPALVERKKSTCLIPFSVLFYTENYFTPTCQLTQNK